MRIFWIVTWQIRKIWYAVSYVYTVFVLWAME